MYFQNKRKIEIMTIYVNVVLLDHIYTLKRNKVKGFEILMINNQPMYYYKCFDLIHLPFCVSNIGCESNHSIFNRLVYYCNPAHIAIYILMFQLVGI